MIKRIARKIKKKAKNKYRQYLISHSVGKKAEMSVQDILYCNSDERLGPQRHDVICRYITISKYKLGDENCFSLYRKMQEKRKGEHYPEKAVEKFKQLIQSYDENGYDRESRILLDRNLNLIDGSHRLALALYHGYSTISALIIPVDFQTKEYSLDWFIMNGFTKSETEEIVDCRKILMNKMKKSLSAVVWAPAVPFIQEIINDLGFFGRVSGVRKYRFPKEKYDEVVRRIYAIDDIEEWKIEKKLEHMKEYDPELISFDINVPQPIFRIKKKTGLPLSRIGERMKKVVRTKYAPKIDHYFFDIILHIGDNYYQSDQMRAIFDECRKWLTEEQMCDEEDQKKAAQEVYNYSLEEWYYT